MLSAGVASSAGLGYGAGPSIGGQRPTNNSFSIDGLQEFLTDVAPGDGGERSVGLSAYGGNQIVSYLYANDSQRVRPNLTVNAGLRYEYTTVPAGAQLQSLNAASSVPGVITFAAPHARKKNFAPRLGIAYSPGKNATASIRAGFGMAYDHLYDNLGLLSLRSSRRPTTSPETRPTSWSATTGSRNFLVPSNPDFNNFGKYSSSNPRTIQVVGRFVF
jgi:hypothetical protein